MAGTGPAQPYATPLDVRARKEHRVSKVAAATVADFGAADDRTHAPAFGGVDFTDAEGKSTMHVINAVAEFERDLLKE